MMKIKVQDNQTIFDIALQYTGSIDSVMDILLHNGKTDDTLLIDEIIEIPYVVNQSIVDYFAAQGISIATSTEALDTSQYVPEPNQYLVELTINGVAYKDLLAPELFDIPLVDSDGNDVDYSLNGDMVVVNELPVQQSSTALLLKSGQLTSLYDYDDGYYQDGRPEDFFILDEDENNNWGHRYRFVGTTGGYTDGNDYFDIDGDLTTRALAFPNRIVIDFSTYSKRHGLVVGYDLDFKSSPTGTREEVANYCNNLVLGGFSAWRPANVRAVDNILLFRGNGVCQHKPFENNSFDNFHISTAFLTNQNSIFYINIGTGVRRETSNTYSGGRVIPVRTFGIIGTNLT